MILAAVTEPFGIGSIVAGVFAFLTGLMAWINSKNAVASSKDNSIKLEAIHIQMNSRLDELVKVTKEIAHAAGFQAGQQAQKASSDAEALARAQGAASTNSVK